MDDVTERRRAEESLRKSEVRLHRTFDNMLEGCQIIGFDWRYLYVNRSVTQHGKRTPEELVGRTMMEAYPGIERTEMFAMLRRCMEERTAHRMQNRFENPDGSVGWFDLSIQPSPEGIFVLSNDITERVEAEEALRRSEKRVLLLLDSTGEAIYGLDLEGRCTFVNAACLRMLGYDRSDELLGRNMHEVVHSSHADGSRYLIEDCRIYQAARAGREAHVDGETLWRRDGTSFPVESWTHPILEDGRLAGAVSTFIDVTDRHRMEQQFRQAQKMDAIGRLAGGVAHDFNNLLTVIGGFGSLLQQTMPPDDPGRPLLDEVLKAGERAATLTRQLLAFSRKQVLTAEVLDLNAIVASMERMLARLIGEDIDVVTIPGKGLGAVRADHGQIEQVIMNLAVNARDAMPEGGKLTIETANVDLDEAYARKRFAVEPGPYVMLSVSDMGVGMTPEVMAQIFEPFFTTKEPGKGTGLGLATVHGIVRQSGGNIFAYSEPGKGTVFKVYLPRVREQAPEPARPPAAELARGSETVLVVEDEPAVRQLACTILRNQGYRVLAAANAGEAERALAAHPSAVHLLITDVVMPGLGGPELAKRLCAIRPGLQVLFVSGYSDEAIVRHGVIETGTMFLQKPFTPAALARKVRGLLDQA